MLVLASESTYRKALLSRLGLPFRQAAHKVDEAGYAEKPRERVAVLALAKARSLRKEFPDATIIGSDQLAELAGEALGKPGNRDAARNQLRMLSGRTHFLYTAVAVVSAHRPPAQAMVVHRMAMRELSDDEIERYLDAENTLDCAGSYKIEGLGISLFDAIAGDDMTAIEGLPLLTLAGMLREAGYHVP